MKNITAFRSASVLLFIFCLMHTGGGMLAQKSLGVASDTVFEAMKRTHFDFNGADCTWYGFWFGFGLTASIFLLLSAIVAWELERIPNELWPRLCAWIKGWPTLTGSAACCANAKALHATRSPI